MAKIVHGQGTPLNCFVNNYINNLENTSYLCIYLHTFRYKNDRVFENSGLEHGLKCYIGFRLYKEHMKRNLSLF